MLLRNLPVSKHPPGVAAEIAEEQVSEDVLQTDAPLIPSETQPVKEIPDKTSINFDTFRKNFNNNALVKDYNIMLEDFYPEDDQENIDIIESWLGEGGQCFVGELNGVDGYVIAQYAEGGSTISKMAFFCDIEYAYKEAMVNSLSLCFILAINPDIEVLELDDLETAATVKLYGVEYDRYHMTPEDETPYYVTTAVFYK